MRLSARVPDPRRARRFLAGAAFLSGFLILVPTAAVANGGEKKDIEVGVYTGSMAPDDYDSLDPDNGLFWGLRGGYWFSPKWSVEGTFQRFSTEGDVAGTSPSIDLDSLRGNGLWNFRPGKKFRWFLTLGLGKEKVESDDLDIEESKLGWNYGGGARWFFGKSKFWGLRADARWVTVDPGGDIDGSQTNFEWGGGLMFTFGGGEPPDSDGDKVNDKADKCAGTPKGAVVDPNGCPKDSDGDRVYDGLDKCAATPAGWKVDSTGCPADADGDGVADMVDKCAGTPKEAKVDVNGCPVEDADKDGVWDKVDRCPDTGGDLKVDPVGCPVDADKDGNWDKKTP